LEISNYPLPTNRKARTTNLLNYEKVLYYILPNQWQTNLGAATTTNTMKNIYNCSYLSVKKAGRIYVTEPCGCKAKIKICYDKKDEFVCLKHFNSMSKRFELIKRIFTYYYI